MEDAPEYLREHSYFDLKPLPEDPDPDHEHRVVDNRERAADMNKER